MGAIKRTVGGIFGGPSLPDAPPPVIIQQAGAPKAPPTAASPAVQKKREEERLRRAFAGETRLGTLLTAPTKEEGSTAKVLLGV